VLHAVIAIFTVVYAIQILTTVGNASSLMSGLGVSIGGVPTISIIITVVVALLMLGGAIFATVGQLRITISAFSGNPSEFARGAGLDNIGVGAIFTMVWLWILTVAVLIVSVDAIVETSNYRSWVGSSYTSGIITTCVVIIILVLAAAIFYTVYLSALRKTANGIRRELSLNASANGAAGAWYPTISAGTSSYAAAIVQLVLFIVLLSWPELRLVVSLTGSSIGWMLVIGAIANVCTGILRRGLFNAQQQGRLG
jgi:hypothetical protein